MQYCIHFQVRLRYKGQDVQRHQESKDELLRVQLKAVTLSSLFHIYYGTHKGIKFLLLSSLAVTKLTLLLLLLFYNILP